MFVTIVFLSYVHRITKRENYYLPLKMSLFFFGSATFIIIGEDEKKEFLTVQIVGGGCVILCKDLLGNISV